MVVVVDELPLDVHDLGVHVLVGVGPRPVQVLAHKVASENVPDRVAEVNAQRIDRTKREEKKKLNNLSCGSIF